MTQPDLERSRVEAVQNPVARALARVWYWIAGGAARDAGRRTRERLGNSR